MITFIAGVVVGAIAGSVTSYFVLRNNPKQAAVVAQAANTVAAEVKKL
jgi:hypothetical protein